MVPYLYFVGYFRQRDENNRPEVELRAVHTLHVVLRARITLQLCDEKVTNKVLVLPKDMLYSFTRR